MRRSRVVLAVLVAIGTLRAAEEPLTLVRSIALPGVEGRIDHLALDPKSGRLFVAALGNNTLEVVDVAAGTHVKSLQGFREPQGIAFLPDSGSVAIANGQGEGIQVLRASDFQTGAAVALGEDADNVRYDAAAKRVYVGYGGGAIVAVNAADWRSTGKADLPGHPESFQLDRSGSRIFVNVPTAAQIAVIDRATMRVTATWPVKTARSNFPMALDESGHHLIIGCRNPAKALVFDTSTGAELAAFDIVGDTDDLFYDATRKRLYVIGGEGAIDVFADDGGARFSRVAKVATAAGARTGLYSSDRNELYLAVPHRGAQRTEIRVYTVR